MRTNCASTRTLVLVLYYTRLEPLPAPMKSVPLPQSRTPSSLVIASLFVNLASSSENRPPPVTNRLSSAYSNPLLSIKKYPLHFTTTTVHTHSGRNLPLLFSEYSLLTLSTPHISIRPAHNVTNCDLCHSVAIYY